ncbi:unnamed protein product, partial [Nesidiocoris tenuis]
MTILLILCVPVPEYQFVHLGPGRSKRSAAVGTSRTLHLSAFGQNLQLNLEKTKLTRPTVPLYSVHANSTGHLIYQLLEHE